jgi:hypothetical protein
LENFKILETGNLEIVFMLCKKAKTGKKRCNAKMRMRFEKIRIARLKYGGGGKIDRSIAVSQSHSHRTASPDHHTS